MAATFEEIIASAGLPEAATEPLRKAWSDAFGLITKNNERIAQINAAKAQDPSNVDYIDSLWKLHAKNDSEMSQIEEQFDEVAEMYEKLLKRLRDFGKTKVPTPLSDEETKSAKKLVAESDDAIKAARSKFLAMAEMFDGILGSMGKGVDGGLGKLLPEADSLKNLRGRKSATGEKSHITRIGGALLNGKNIEKDGKANFRYLADEVSKLFGSDKFPENKVTGEELEEKLFATIEKPFRSVKSTELPAETNFDFTKEVKIGENTTEVRTVKITIKKVDTQSADTQTETAKVEPVVEKANVPAEKQENTPAPAKKTATTQAKPAAK